LTMCKCLREMGALTASLLLLGVNVIDIVGASVLLASALYGVWQSFAAGIIAASYACYLMIFVVAVNAFGVVMQPGRRALTASLWTVWPALMVELAVLGADLILGRGGFVDKATVDRHAKTGQDAFWLLGQRWLLLALAARHVVRFFLTLSLRGVRDGIVNSDEAEARAEVNADLAERLVQRDLRRDRREDLRTYFAHKYFGGRDVDGNPAPTRADQPRAELPSYLISRHRDDVTAGGDQSDDWPI